MPLLREEWGHLSYQFWKCSQQRLSCREDAAPLDRAPYGGSEPKRCPLRPQTSVRLRPQCGVLPPPCCHTCSSSGFPFSTNAFPSVASKSTFFPPSSRLCVPLLLGHLPGLPCRMKTCVLLNQQHHAREKLAWKEERRAVF